MPAEHMDTPQGAPAPRSLAEGKLLLERPAEHVVCLRIANPHKRNALDHPILDALGATLRELAAAPPQEVRCLMLAGSDRIFSAGYDIGAVHEADFEERAERLVAHPFTAAIDELAAFPAPTVAVLSGHAIGGGLELAAACDLRIGHERARVGMPPGRLGLIYSHTGVARFIATIGAARTRELFLLGENIDAHTALSWGLLNRVVPEPELERSALELACTLARRAPLSQRGNKRIIAELLRAMQAIDPELEAELVALRRSSFASEDLREGMLAFAEKRAPRWRGQ